MAALGRKPPGRLASGLESLWSDLALVCVFIFSKNGWRFCNAGGGEDPPPASRLLWFELPNWKNISVASYLYFSGFAQRPLKQVPGSDTAGLRRAGVHIVGRVQMASATQAGCGPRGVCASRRKGGKVRDDGVEQRRKRFPVG